MHIGWEIWTIFCHTSVGFVVWRTWMFPKIVVNNHGINNCTRNALILRKNSFTATLVHSRVVGTRRRRLWKFIPYSLLCSLSQAILRSHTACFSFGLVSVRCRSVTYIFELPLWEWPSANSKSILWTFWFILIKLTWNVIQSCIWPVLSFLCKIRFGTISETGFSLAHLIWYFVELVCLWTAPESVCFSKRIWFFPRRH